MAQSNKGQATGLHKGLIKVGLLLYLHISKETVTGLIELPVFDGHCMNFFCFASKKHSLGI